MVPFFSTLLPLTQEFRKTAIIKSIIELLVFVDLVWTIYGIIHLVRTQIFPKTNIFNSLIRVRIRGQEMLVFRDVLRKYQMDDLIWTNTCSKATFKKLEWPLAGIRRMSSCYVASLLYVQFLFMRLLRYRLRSDDVICSSAFFLIIKLIWHTRIF